MATYNTTFSQLLSPKLSHSFIYSPYHSPDTPHVLPLCRPTSTLDGNHGSWFSDGRLDEPG